MARRNKNTKLLHWEVRLIKAMIEHCPDKTDQDILPYFTRPTRSINQARIGGIHKGSNHKSTVPASKEELEIFLENWPLIDPKTGLHLYGDELLIKAREAILLAVQSYNNPTAYFKSEVFIVTAIIAWTYLMHAYYKKEGVDYKIYQDGNVKQTRYGADMYWGLGQCLGSQDCPLPQGIKDNLDYLIGIRNEIEHQMTKKIDDRLGPQLHACCLNFNTEIQKLFGKEYAVDKELTFSLQFASFSEKQRQDIAKLEELPDNLSSFITTFNEGLSDVQKEDQAFKIQYFLLEKNVAKKNKSDQVIEFVKASSDIGSEANRILFKDREHDKLKPSQVVQLMNDEGFINFSMHQHTKLWQSIGAKEEGKSFGVLLSDNQWYWYNSWVERVREHCNEHADIYRNDN